MEKDAEKIVKISVELSPAQAMALAQFVKRSQWETFLSCAVNKDEAYLMIDAINAVKRSLDEEGYSPR